MIIDFNNKLEIKISNKDPVLLADLTLSLLNVSNQFQKFIENETNQDYNASSNLYIKEVRSGSIVIEVIAHTFPILPLIWTGGPLSEWVTQAQEIVSWLLGKLDKPPKEFSKNDFKQWHSILEPIAKDNASQMNFTVSGGGKVINNFFINSQDANAAQNQINREIEKLDTPNEHIQKRKVMIWNQTKFDFDSHTGDKAIIESITKKPVKVIFENNLVKESILKGDERFSKPWHKLAYIVDVEVQTVDDIPKVYTVLRYYPEDTFDLDD